LPRQNFYVQLWWLQYQKLGGTRTFETHLRIVLLSRWMTMRTDAHADLMYEPSMAFASQEVCALFRSTKSSHIVNALDRPAEEIETYGIVVWVVSVRMHGSISARISNLLCNLRTKERGYYRIHRNISVFGLGGLESEIPLNWDGPEICRNREPRIK
jgi:hypothetical protein